MKNFPHLRQTENKDCGPTCLKMVAKYYGKNVDIQTLRDFSETTREGSNLYNLSDAAEKIGFRSLGMKTSLERIDELPLPCILHWNKGHFVVLYKIRRGTYYVSDPAIGQIEYSKKEFLKFWIGNNADISTSEGVALLMEPSPAFYKDDADEPTSSSLDFGSLFTYLKNYRSFVIQLAVGLLTGIVLDLIFPFLTQSIVDVGIQNQNMGFIYLILMAQLFLFFGKSALDIIRSWIILHLSARINISLISDFFIKLMNLPISFFDVRMTGDIMQRINDHSRIEKILTTSSLSVLFSILNMLVLGCVLAYFNGQIFTIFFVASLLYFLWVILFLKRREKLDYKRFSEVSQEQSKVIELINGMQEIKLNNAEKQKRWNWEHVQARLFKVSMKGLVLEQTQSIGSNLINELKNILIIFFAAKLVIDGEITLGTMLAISGIVGGLNGPILQLINFIREAQDAKISLSRLSEIHRMDDETTNLEQQIQNLPVYDEIELRDISFRYTGSETNVLQSINLKIPSKKITAIVGASGSGKTTLMKVLLKFYSPTTGDIFLQSSIENRKSISLSNIAQKTWRNHVGTVMQEGYIFNDTIAQNIAIGSDTIDRDRLFYASEVANIKDFISSHALGFNTVIGMEGVGMSTGQKQRLFIARAVYKNPEILFFDEATSALDANNEKEIMAHLNTFFANKTVVIIAHRLSTVVNADQIVVLEGGCIVETGTHEELIKNGKHYFKLIKNQLQLGN